MDIRKYLVQLNKSSGEYVPMVYDKDEKSTREHHRKLTCNQSRTTTSKFRSKQFVINSETQYALDLGQPDFDPIECKICKMLYTRGESKDERHHTIYHDQFVNSPKFPNWKVERIICFFNNGDRIISIYPNDAKHMINKVEELVRISDNELGIQSPFENLLKNIDLFLIYVTHNRRVGGFTAGERINQACELISDRPWTLSMVNEEASVGIARLWVHESFRRQRIATRLIEILRANLYKDRIVPKDKIAFSESTTCGIAFAKHYTKRNLLIYASPT